MAYIEELIENNAKKINSLETKINGLENQLKTSNMMCKKLFDLVQTITISLVDICDGMNSDNTPSLPDPDPVDISNVKREEHVVMSRAPSKHHSGISTTIPKMDPNIPRTFPNVDAHIKSFKWEEQGKSKYANTQAGVYKVIKIYKQGKNGQWTLVLFQNIKTGKFFTAPGSSSIYRKDISPVDLINQLRKFETERGF